MIKITVNVSGLFTKIPPELSALAEILQSHHNLDSVAANDVAPLWNLALPKWQTCADSHHIGVKNNSEKCIDRDLKLNEIPAL